MLAAQTRPVDVPLRNAPPERSHGMWKHIVGPVEPFLQAVAEQLVEQVQAFDPEIATYARYALTNQGKQLRPALVALSAGAIGPVTPQQVRVAVIIEMVHLATLVHDDIMDAAEMRRRRPTLAATWGNEISVLVGDCLFANALKLAASFPTPEICRAVSAATNTVCTGEILQTNRRLNFDFTRAEYFKVLAMKTAEFFALSCELGARLSGASDEERTALRDYGMALGIAYQVYDDCLDLFGSEDMVGKSLGTDLASGKLTLPVLVVLETARKADRERLKDLIEHWEPHYHPRVLELMDKHDALAQSQSIIKQYLRSGQQSLAVIPPSEARAGLIGLTDYLAQQTDALGFPY